jgi:predicted urease superfamily metal-dependent hydrolase
MARSLNHSVTYTNSETGEIETKNANFIQLYKDNIQLISQMAAERPAALRIFLWIAQLMDDKNALATSQTAISEALNLHRNTVTQAIAYLKEKKVMAILKTGSSHVYVLNNEIVWQDLSEAKKYALFTAKIYLAKSEQEISYNSVRRSVAVKAVPKDRTTIKSMRST